MAVRQKKELTEEQKTLRQFHKKSARHVVVFEADLSENEKRQIFSDADDLRQCGNRLLEIMKRNHEQLLRTKRYSALQSLYGKIAEAIRTLEAKESRTDEQEQKLEQLKEKRSSIVKAMAQLQQYYVTWDFCRTKMMELKDQYKIPSIFALSRAEAIWQAVETNMYASGKTLHFKKRGDLPEIRAKQCNRGIVISQSESGIKFQYGKLSILCKWNENRTFAIREQVNHLRALGDCFVTEPANAKKLQKRANPEVKTDKNGRMKRKKRFGRSIKNRCPGYMQAKAKQLFESTGGTYIEVPMEYRASQYDHTAGTYIKKELSQRMYCLSDGTKVQRDWYSSYLLYCISNTYTQIDKRRCKQKFTTMYLKERQMIETIIRSGKKILNSGIHAM